MSCNTQHSHDELQQAKDNQRFKDFLATYADDRDENRKINQEILSQLKVLSPMVSRHELALYGEQDGHCGALKRIDKVETELEGTKWQAALGLIGVLGTIITGVIVWVVTVLPRGE